MSVMLRERYLDLLERTLCGVLIEDAPIVTEEYKSFYRSMALEIFGEANPPEEDMYRYQPELRRMGWDQPSLAFTMVGLERLRNFRRLLEIVIEEGVSGDIIETGVWRGGASILAKAVLVAHDQDRRVILADSFEGLPAPDSGSYPKDAGSVLHQEAHLAISVEEVERNFEKFDLLDDRVVFLKGWFRDTMPAANLDALAVMRLDGDMYESTILPLQYLYDRLSPGGFVIIDDYWIPACRAAVDDFLAQRGLEPEVLPIDSMGSYFRKAS